VFMNEPQCINQLLVSCKSTAELRRSRFKRKKKDIADSWCELFEMARHS